MNRTNSLVVIALSFAFAACGGGGASLASPDTATTPLVAAGPGRFIVTLDPSAGNPEVLARGMTAPFGVVPARIYTHALSGFAAVLPPRALAALAADSRVLAVEADMVAHANAQILPEGIDRTGADQNGWAAIDGVDSRVDVDIASIDTGVDLDHPDLNVYRGVDCTKGPSCDKGGDGDDDNGHGTHTSGTAAALDNGFGVVGMAPGARIWAVKVLGRSGSGFWSDIIEGMDYVTAHADEIEVANMSLGSIGQLSAVRTAAQNMVAAGVVLVTSAGNDSRDVYGPDGAFGTNDDDFPSSYPEAMTVSAMADTDGTAGGLGGGSCCGADDTFATFTNFSRSVVGGNPVSSPGAAIDLAAPGADVLSTYPGGYATGSGTSMSSPTVAGGVALYIAEHGRATNAAGVYAIRQAMIDAGESQPWRPAGSNDPDTNPERLLNVASGPAPPPNEAPVVAITAPADGSTQASGATIAFAGSATDSEDGDISASMTWVSSIDGAIGAGAAFSTVLSDGSHTITASATDSGAKTGTDSISIVVGSVTALVVVVETDKPVYAHKDRVFITITVSDGANPVAGAAVHLEIVTANGKTLSGDAVTDSNGEAAFSHRANSKSQGAGTYTATADATAAGYDPGSGSTTYEVTN